MADPVWNDDMYGKLELGAKLSERDAFVRFETDIGPGTSQLRDTVSIFDVRGRVTFPSPEHKLRFRAFYVQDLQRGSKRFRWTSPITGRPATFQFRAAPEWYAVGAYVGTQSAAAPGGSGAGASFIEVQLVMVES